MTGEKINRKWDGTCQVWGSVRRARALACPERAPWTLGGTGWGGGGVMLSLSPRSAARAESKSSCS